MGEARAATTEASEVLPQSRRPDGTLRPAVRVRKGYVPPEEQKKYDRWQQNAAVPGEVLGAEPSLAQKQPKSKTASKNEKRKQKKKGEETVTAADGAAAGAEPGAATDARKQSAKGAKADPEAAKQTSCDPSAATAAEGASEVEKKIKNLKKRLRQIDELEAKAKEGVELNVDQAAKVAARAEVEAEIAKWESLGDADLGKKAKGLKKKLRQIEELEAKRDSGVELNEGACTLPSLSPPPLTAPLTQTSNRPPTLICVAHRPPFAPCPASNSNPDPNSSPLASHLSLPQPLPATQREQSRALPPLALAHRAHVQTNPARLPPRRMSKLSSLCSTVSWRGCPLRD